MDTLVYDFAIVGAGAAGIHLMTAMMEDPWISDKKILILDKDQKNANDNISISREAKSAFHERNMIKMVNDMNDSNRGVGYTS